MTKFLKLRLPEESSFCDDHPAWASRNSHSHRDDTADWIFVEVGVETDGEYQYWPIHWLTTVEELSAALNHPEFPSDAELIWHGWPEDK